MARRNILWLVSWYPSKEDRFLGDFIQRHARAAAIFHNIHVIYVCDSNERCAEEITESTGLTEQVIYIPKKQGIVNRILKQWKWRSAYLDAVQQYINKNGKPDLVHVHVPWKAGIIALQLKKKYNLDFILSEHWGIYNKSVPDNYFKQPVYRKNFIAAVFKNARLCISVSTFLAKSVTSILGEKEFVIIPNVVDTTMFYYTTEKNKPFTFIHVSNMVPLKNVEGILKAFDELNKTEENVRLLLIGNKHRELEFQQEYAHLINKSIFFIGEISYAEVASHMRESHALIINSIMENAPCVISEALCCGLPIIATNVGGIPEMVNETNGKMILVEDDKKSLVDALKHMLLHYNNYDQRSISKTASGKYSYTTISNAFNDLYNSLL
jgi:Glycosyltransferase